MIETARFIDQLEVTGQIKIDWIAGIRENGKSNKNGYI